MFLYPSIHICHDELLCVPINPYLSVSLVYPWSQCGVAIRVSCIRFISEKASWTPTYDPYTVGVFVQKWWYTWVYPMLCKFWWPRRLDQDKPLNFHGTMAPLFLTLNSHLGRSIAGPVAGSGTGGVHKLQNHRWAANNPPTWTDTMIAKSCTSW